MRYETNFAMAMRINQVSLTWYSRLIKAVALSIATYPRHRGNLVENSRKENQETPDSASPIGPAACKPLPLTLPTPPDPAAYEQRTGSSRSALTT